MPKVSKIARRAFTAVNPGLGVSPTPGSKTTYNSTPAGLHNLPRRCNLAEVDRERKA